MSHLTQSAVPRIAGRSPRRDTAVGGVLGLLALAALVLGLTIGDPDGRIRGSSTAESIQASGNAAPMSRPAPARPDESAVAAAVGIRPVPARPDESAVAAAVGIRPAPAGPDESAVAATIGRR